MFLPLRILGFLFFTIVSDRSAESIVNSVQTAYRSASSLQATFLERYSENGHLVRVESGIAYFRRPGKMRWEYEAPEKNLFLVDGKFAWFYVSADRTVTKIPAKDSSDWRTPLALLAGEMKISRVCAKVERATAEPAQAPDGIVLYCQLKDHAQTPKQPSRVSTQATDAVFFEVAPNTGKLTRILIRESGGIQVEFQFTGWQFNPPIPQSMFQFVPPLGVTIVNGELPADVGPVK
jgi:outer membrane lipoprotein carrier protein